MILQEIGRGVHGKVKLARDTNTGECVAIKIVDKRNRKRQLGHSLRPVEGESEHKVRREIAILKKCVHPHVVRLLEVMDDPASRKIYMVLENMKGGELIWKDEDGPRLSIERVKSIFRDVVSGLDYLHYQGIIHRDIKPANLLLTEDQVVKISDFGVSYFNQHLAGKPLSNLPDRQMDRELAETAGTPAFFAPELCSTTCDTDNGEDNISNSNSNGNGNGNGGDDLSNVRITKAIDVWALGVTLYCLLFGKCPFMAATEFELFDAIPVQPLTFPANFADQDCKDLLLGLLTKNPDARMTLDQVKVHPWVISDLAYPIIWWQEADPRQYKTVEVTDDDVNQAVTIMARLRNTFNKMSSSFTHLTNSITRRRSKSVSHSQAPLFLPSTPPWSGHEPFTQQTNWPFSESLVSQEEQEEQEEEEEDGNWREVTSSGVCDELTVQFSRLS
ncbi:kinase-like domain-containing protein [Phycomyces blakesleeanus]|uniref:Kinase-like domain-containing protein n=1 Tax=Phycomyces blakesleeanus TaxID=4837 RepID=A0ABR3APG5_PHYBL